MRDQFYKKLSAPLAEEEVQELKVGDQVLLSGSVLTARDASHKRLIELKKAGIELPVSLEGEIIYYVGPTPAKPGHVIGSAGPTTSSRMDRYTTQMLELGAKAFIGKGYRSQTVKNALQKHKGVYLAAVGGAGALIKESIVDYQVIAFEDLGPEAIRRLEVKNFPVLVANDIYGNDLYQQGKNRYAK
ncbi:Fe-S-containing hydro-lyase [Natranaerobius thermophilus]|uniref:Hydro-lyase, Fe-S type, tartrate/fumarate subfamily, beta subunit n=1 Tax=Natranaerobius thermophilus (strain ATCC BAA-1301 / DSM 18059 / JW/NM-WN-LF) TaxID=457570 RepID=B2A0T2_NATTJ|nr:Fe-S-containing hydro-lyase [Natranaerobius thermophilus]ACB85962.1 hydro-lyase, Fe-S type, tartrate/fumarate subfamily, beta subunit [Natranaerobius thermophilus JW/NM-WN-LF]